VSQKTQKNQQSHKHLHNTQFIHQLQTFWLQLLPLHFHSLVHQQLPCSSPSFWWFLSCSLQFIFFNELWFCAWHLAVSWGCVNHDIIALRFSRFQCLQLASFALAQSTLCLASASALCCCSLPAANASSSFFLLISWTLSRIIPLLRFTCALKAASSCPWLVRWICCSCWHRASFLAFSHNLWSTHWLGSFDSRNYGFTNEFTLVIGMVDCLVVLDLLELFIIQQIISKWSPALFGSSCPVGFDSGEQI